MDKSRGVFPKHVKTALWTVFVHLNPDKHEDELDKALLQRLCAYVATTVNKFHQEQELKRYLPYKKGLTFEEFLRYVQSYIVKPTDSPNFDIVDNFCWRTVYRARFLEAVQRWSRLGPTEEAGVKLSRVFHCLSVDHTISPSEAFCIVNRLNRTLHARSTNSLSSGAGLRSGGRGGTGLQAAAPPHDHDDALDRKPGDHREFAQQRYTYWHLLNCIVDILPARVDQGSILRAIEELENEVVHSLVKQGLLVKKGHTRHNWKERWFVLTPGMLKYYQNAKLTTLKGVVYIGRNSKVERVEGKTKYPNRFSLTCSKSGKAFEIYSESFEAIESWISVLKFVAVSDCRTLLEMSIIEHQKKMSLKAFSHLPGSQQLKSALERYDHISRKYSVRRFEKNRSSLQKQEKDSCDSPDGTVQPPLPPRPAATFEVGEYINFPLRKCPSTDSCSSECSIGSHTASSCELQHSHRPHDDSYQDPIYSDLERELDLVRCEIAHHEYLILGRPPELIDRTELVF